MHHPIVLACTIVACTLALARAGSISTENGDTVVRAANDVVIRGGLQVNGTKAALQEAYASELAALQAKLVALLDIVPHCACTSACAPNPCANNGICSTVGGGGGGFACDCTSTGFTGATCAMPTDGCSSSPCANSATCAALADSYTCICALGTTGSQCTVDIIECVSSPCLNGGTCSEAGNEYSCLCALGFTGNVCEANISECQSTPCHNGGTCNEGVGSFTCTCASGYTGNRCALNVDDCASSPCQNSGVCNDGINSYTCTCAPGYSGTLCTIDTDECESSPCQNGGTCNDGINSYTCTCTPGYTDNRCATSRCNTMICQNGGTCGHIATYTQSVTTAQDPDGTVEERLTLTGVPADPITARWNTEANADFGLTTETMTLSAVKGSYTHLFFSASGADCVPMFDTATLTPSEVLDMRSTSGEISFDLTYSSAVANICIGAYVTVELEVTYEVATVCTCAPGYSGTLCTINTDECESSPCHNGGTCNDGVDSFTCTCASGYTGNRCALNVDDCASSPCQNSGVCNDGINSYTCTCAPGYSGTLCTIDTDVCESSPCQNGGTCNDGINSYTCTCTPGYADSRCATSRCENFVCQNGGTCGHIATYTQSVTTAQEPDGTVEERLTLTGVPADPITARWNTEADADFGHTTETMTLSAVTGSYTHLFFSASALDCEPMFDTATLTPSEVLDMRLTTGQISFDLTYSSAVGADICIDGYVTVELEVTYEVATVCTCAPGYSGSVCSTNINDCSPNPCVHGTCADGVNSFLCSCTNGYSGSTCANNIDDCSPNPCVHGTCSDGIGSFVCICDSGYSGTTCNEFNVVSCSGGTSLTQTQLDAKAGCTHMTSDLSLGIFVDSLVALSSLRSAKSVDIRQTDLVSLSGLNKLATVTGDFDISNNGKLSSFSDLANLKTVTGELLIFNNSGGTVSNLDVVASLTSLGDIWIQQPSSSMCASTISYLQGLTSSFSTFAVTSKSC